MMKRKALALALALTMLFSLLPLAAVSAEESAPTPGDTVVAKLDGADITLNALTEQLKTDDCSGKTLQLTQNIVVETWTSVPVFRGTLDGAGFGISGLNAPLFVQLERATVKNLTVEGKLTAVIANNEVGLLAGRATGSVNVENVVTKGSIEVGGTTSVFAGGFFGQANDANMKNCVNQADILVGTTNNTSLIGGLIGQVASLNSSLGAVTLQNCANYGDVIDSGEPTGSAVRSGSKAGGLIGVINNAGKDIAMTLCYNGGAVSAMCYAGGLSADVRGNLTADQCINVGAVTVRQPDDKSGNAYAGGLIGQFYNNSYAVIRSSINSGAVAAVSPAGSNNSRAGGIVGTTNRVLEVSDCFNSGAVSAKYMAGGIAGEMGSTATSTRTFGILNCVSVGTVSSNAENGPDSNICGLLGALGNHSGGKNLTFRLENSYYLAGADGMKALGTTLNRGYQANGNGFAVTLTYGADTQTLQQESQNFLTFAANIVAEVTEAGGKADTDAIQTAHPVYAVGLQQTAVSDNTYDIRLIAGLNSLEYSAVGFELIRLEEGSALSGMVERSSDTVYTTLTGYDESGAEKVYSASEDFGCSYLSAVTVRGIPADRTVTFVLRPYLTSMDGEIQYCGPACIVTFVNGVLQAAE